MRKAISALLAPAVLCGFTIVFSGCAEESGVKTDTTIKTPDGSSTRETREIKVEKKGENAALGPVGEEVRASSVEESKYPGFKRNQWGGDRSMVNTQVLQGQWNQVRGQLKKKWGQLTDDDLRFANGNIDQLIGRIQHKTGEARDAVEGFLDELTSHGASAISQATETAASTSVRRWGREGTARGRAAKDTTGFPANSNGDTKCRAT